MNVFMYHRDEEIWTELIYDIIEPVYEISNTGFIRNTNSGKILKGYIDTKGYVQVMLKVTGQIRIKKYRIHVLVANTFLWYEKSDIRNTVNHIGSKSKGDKVNNHVDNLEWVSNEDNIKHAKEAGLIHKGEECHNSKFTDDQVISICEMLENDMSYSHIISNMDLVDNKSMRAALYRIRKRIAYTHISKDYEWDNSISSNGKRKLRSFEDIQSMKKLIIEGRSFEEICGVLNIRNNSSNRDLYRNIVDGNAYR